MASYLIQLQTEADLTTDQVKAALLAGLILKRDLQSTHPSSTGFDCGVVPVLEVERTGN